MRPIRVGLLGIGTVGGGTWDVLNRNADEIQRRAGRAIQITRVADKDVARAKKITKGKAKLSEVAFEAAVAGGVPIIKALREGLTANRIEWIAGIINGTSNFILSEMREKGLPFDAALKDAQQRGYAEADPTFDIEGIDAAHKLTILSAIALGITKKTKKGIELRVHPTLIPAKRLIANVEGVMNAILVNGDAVGPTLYYGAGAGSQPTASDVETSYYLRMRVADKPGVLADITRILADCRISIEAMVQKQPAHSAEGGERAVDIVMLTHRALERDVDQAMAKIGKLKTVL